MIWNIFFQPISYFYFLASIKKLKSVHFLKSNLSTFNIMDHTFGVRAKKSLTNTKVTMISSYVFIIWCLFYYLAFHLACVSLWLNFFIWDKIWFKFRSLNMDMQFFQHHLLKKISFLHWITFVPLVKFSYPWRCESISGFHSLSLILFVFLCLWYPVLSDEVLW